MSVISYKIRARSKWNWKDFDTVRMEISVGQEYHEGEKLRLTMDWARENFKHKVLILGDTTQRFNTMFKTACSEEEAVKITRRLGDEWLERNKSHLYDIQITRWDDWKSHPDYEETYAAVCKLYDTHKPFHLALLNASQEYWLRQNLPEKEKERFFMLSKQYLLEETAIFAVAYGEIGGISAYPGSYLELWEMFIGQTSQDFPKGLSKGYWARLSFTKKKTEIVAA